ncbi:MAG TPA: hypothetical protein VFD75_06580 [Pyrinomonadaceae bacterium]|nr:hypothetical protein [Pyrinomonadaceae bacterium]
MSIRAVGGYAGRVYHYCPTPVPNLTSPFYRALKKALAERGQTTDAICPAHDSVARRVLHDYGAMFIGSRDILPPPVCVFTSEDEVTNFQKAAGWAGAKIGDEVIELQPAAMTGLLKARAAARAEGLDISPRDGAEGARRNYADTVRLWNSRFLPALDHWQSMGRLSANDTDRLRGLTVWQQVAEVLELEKDGIFFSKDLSKSILYSIAAPGASQHIAMLAFDINEFCVQRVRQLLAEYGWFQTVLSDLPHFTFLGLREDELPARGLKCVDVTSQQFWIPDID